MATFATRLRSLGRLLTLICGGCLLASVSPCQAQDPLLSAEGWQPMDLVMFHDPQLELGVPELRLPTGLKALWLQAMARPDAELRRLAADSFALAHQRGMRDLADTYMPLATLLAPLEHDPSVRRAAAHALIQLDARDHASLLADAAKSDGLTMAVQVEPALARWKSDAMRDTWLARLDNPQAGPTYRLMAIAGLGAIGEPQAAKSLRQLVSDTKIVPAERIAAARAMSRIQPAGLVKLATTLAAAEESPTALLDTLLAIELLQQEDGPESLALLKRFVANASPAIQSGALRRLYAIDPTQVYEFAESAVGSSDSGVRTVGAKALISKKTVASIAPLATLLDDVNPTLRRHVAKSLVELAGEPELREEVITQASMMLETGQWRGLEQAAVVLVLLDHKPAGARLVELLPFERGEVMHAAGWGLRRLAMPEHLPAMLAHAQDAYEGFSNGTMTFESAGSEFKIAQLFMAFGQMRYGEAEPLLRKYVPKVTTLGAYARAAAVWSVGLLNEGKAPQDLTELMIARLADIFSFEPESEVVRQMCAISIGRMKSEFAVPKLKSLVETDGGYPKRATYWALEQLTGEPSPPPDPNIATFGDWFLIPAQ